MITRTYSEVTVTRIDADLKIDSRNDLVFEGDGTAYRRILSSVTDDYIDVPLTGSALDYERRVLEAKQQMFEADQLARNDAKSA